MTRRLRSDLFAADASRNEVVNSNDLHLASAVLLVGGLAPSTLQACIDVVSRLFKLFG